VVEPHITQHTAVNTMKAGQLSSELGLLLMVFAIVLMGTVGVVLMMG
jgi:hypothetical protein